MNPQATTDTPLPPPPPPSDSVPATVAVARKRSEYPGWWEADAIMPWCSHIFGTVIKTIIGEGVTSFADLHRKLQERLKLRVPEEHLRKWLTGLGAPYDTLFTRRKFIQVDPAAVTPPPTNLAPAAPAVPDDEPDAAEIETTVDRPLVAGQRPAAPVINLVSPQAASLQSS